MKTHTITIKSNGYWIKKYYLEYLKRQYY